MVRFLVESNQLCCLGCQPGVIIEGFALIQISDQRLYAQMVGTLTSHVCNVDVMWVAQYIDSHRSQPPMSTAAAFGHSVMAQFQNRTTASEELMTSPIRGNADLLGGGMGGEWNIKSSADARR